MSVTRRHEIGFQKRRRSQYQSTTKGIKPMMDIGLCAQLDDSVISSGFLDTFDYVLSDCDGVLWIKNDPIPGSAEAIQLLKKLGKQVIYITNNSKKSRAEQVSKCKELGFPATLDTFICSSYCAAAYLKSLKFKKKVYIFGCSGISDELDAAGIQHSQCSPDPLLLHFPVWKEKVELDLDVGAVVAGMDPDVSMPKLVKAANYVLNPDTLFIATNKDEKIQARKDIVTPGAGLFVEMIEQISERKAITMGKPEKYILDCIKDIHPDIDFNRCIMIGDCLKTDIFLGSKHGLKTLFVLTGVDTLEDVRQLEKSTNENDHMLIPNYYLPCLGDLVALVK